MLKIWNSSIPCQVLKIYYKMQKVTENDNFINFPALETGLGNEEQMSNSHQLLYSMYIFYKEKFQKVVLGGGGGGGGVGGEFLRGRF